MKPPPPLPYDEALSRLLAAGEAHRLPTATLALESARHGVLAQPLDAPRALPAFDQSAMDGFALAADSVSSESAQTFRLVGERFAGPIDQEPTAEPGSCVRITTGAPLPPGFDRVVVRERAQESDGQVRVDAVPEAGRHVRRRGEDVEAGERVLQAGTVLDAPALALAAALGVDRLELRHAPEVSVLVTGDELRAAGDALRPGEIHESNGTSLRALLAQDYGIEPHVLGLRDEAAAIESALRAASGPGRLVISCGGASVGDRDLMPSLAERLGTVLFWRVAIKPGMPVLLARYDDTLLLSLPGNPVSVFCGYFAFVRPLIDALTARAPRPPPLRARLAQDTPKRHGRRELRRGCLRCDADGRLEVGPHPADASNRLRAVAECNALIWLPEAERDLAAGTLVDVLPYGAILGP